jgi:hypothetical protein
MFSGINRSCRVMAAVTAAALLSLTAACGSDSSDSSTSSGGAAADGGDSDSGGGLGSTITMSFDITGAVTVKGDSSSLPAVDNGADPANCAAYAKGGQKDDEVHYVLPSFMKDKVDGKQLLVGATIDKYTGPGTYGTDQLTDQGTPAGIDIDGKLYFQQSGTKSEAVVNADGGGTWTFTGLDVQNPNNTQGGSPISGKLTWTCKD